MFKPVNQKEDFSSLELTITKFWKNNNIFEKSINQRSIANKYVFYDGPPFITGMPHYGSLLPSIAKDVIPRYQTMRGKRCERVWGWDCHGLPIETKVEKALNIKNRREIEQYGIQKFVDECYRYTRNTSADWKWYVDRIGRWVDFDNSYKTMDQDYMESVIYNFKKLYDGGKVYEGVRTSLFCTRCSTPISNFEIAMDNSYAEMDDPAVTIKFPVVSEGKFKGSNLLAWTTTPWTLPSNKALVLDPKESYVLAKVQKLDIELEKAWLVIEAPKDLNKMKRENITQAYLKDYKDNSGLNFKHARIRKVDSVHTLTLKFFAGDTTETGQLIEKTEVISKERYIELIKQATSKVVKIRYSIPLEGGLIAQLDEYQNNLKGLMVVEVEFPSLNSEKNFKIPEWFGKEVTACNGIYPPVIADLSLEEVDKLNEEFVQPAHNYEDHVLNEFVILAKKRLEFVMGRLDYSIEDTFLGKELIGLKYDPPFKYFTATDIEHKVYEFKDMVTMDDGTGIVHSAPGFGDIDTDMGKHYGLGIAMSINDEGKYFDFITDYKGKYVKDADPFIIEDLKKMNRLFKSERITHRYPFCYRCGTPLLQKAQPSWFIDVQNLKPNLQKNNKNINWVPKHLKEGRFKKGIETAPDWCVSRTRYWASPMPVWQRIENGKVVERVVYGSRDEIRENAMQPITKVVFLRQSLENSEKILELNTSFKETEFDNFFYATTLEGSPFLSKFVINTKEVKSGLGSLGNPEMHQEFINIQTRLLKEHDQSSLGDLSEEVLTIGFKRMIEFYKTEFDKLLNEKAGKLILALTHAEVIVFIRHLYEGRSLKESFSLNIETFKAINMYFNGVDLMDLHRPKIDAITIKGKTGILNRVPEVLDVWMDSASMPYASKHYPFEGKEDFENNFPADFVIEYIAQTRAWFYVMHVLGTALFDSNPFKNVVTTGVIFGTDGRKMSKSYGNYPDPKIILEKYGAEPLRLYLMGSPVMVGEDINLDENGIKDQIRNFVLPLWNCYSFFVTYANLHEYKYEGLAIDNALDKWLIERFQSALKQIVKNYEEYNLPGVVKEYLLFIDDLSRWYIRRSRDRFASGDKSALSTLYFVLIEFSKAIAPMVPFLSEEIYQNLISNDDVTKAESVHLCDFPKIEEQSKDGQVLLDQMNVVREVVNLGQSIRAQKGIKVRQALSSISIKSDADSKMSIDWVENLIKEELNVKEVKWVSALHEDDKNPQIKSEVTDIEVALDTNITEELRNEGIIREFIRLVQDQRKQMKLIIGEEIEIEFSISDNIIKDILLSNIDTLKKALSASEITFEESIDDKDAVAKVINGKNIIINIEK